MQIRGGGTLQARGVEVIIDHMKTIDAGGLHDCHPTVSQLDGAGSFVGGELAGAAGGVIGVGGVVGVGG
ncbi:hypothetical protein DL240_13345, partial [Lujinxingia litoralis]